MRKRRGAAYFSYAAASRKYASTLPLNFSVIGDAVNVAARVEAATRQTGDAVLITDVTRLMLRTPHELDSRGAIELKGKSEPLQLFAPRLLVSEPRG